MLGMLERRLGRERLIPSIERAEPDAVPGATANIMSLDANFVAVVAQLVGELLGVGGVRERLHLQGEPTPIAGRGPLLCGLGGGLGERGLLLVDLCFDFGGLGLA